MSTEHDGILDRMDNMYDAPPPDGRHRRRMVQLGVGITLAGFVAGGGFAAATMASSSALTASQETTPETAGTANTQAGNAELSTLLSAASTPASTTATTATTTGTRAGPLRRLRGIGGYYGSLTYQTQTGVHTVAFERGTIQSINGSSVVVRAPNGVTMTWLLVSNTVVKEHGGKASTTALADGQLVFVGGPVVSEARDARLIVVRTPKSAPTTPASPSPSASASASTPVSSS